MKHCIAHPFKGLEKHQDIALAILRVVVGAFFIMHGASKIFGGIEGTMGFFSGLGIPAFFAYVVGYGEFIGGIFLILGFLTRYTSIYLGIIMIVAFLTTKLGNGIMKGELDLVFLAIFIVLFFMGAGKWSMDGFCKCKKKTKK